MCPAQREPKGATRHEKMQQDPSGPGPGGGHVPVPDRPASAVYCPHDYYASTAVWYTDDGPRLQTRHWQMTIRCHNCGYADAEKEHTFPVRLELPEGCSVLVCRNLRVIGSAPVAV